jgi:D-alanine--poly(phosphoribitol) ligase subunit 1
LYGSLFNGATLVPINKNEALQPKQLLNILEKYNCTTWFSVPSMLMYLQTSRAIIPDKWKNVKKIIFGGEGYPKGKLIQLYNALKANTTIYNVYGPTECTCICSSYIVDENDFIDINGFLPLGKMAENFSYLIVDENGNETDGKGELILRGPNVGLGYYNDIERTQERFIQNPIHNNYIDICYKTGDLVSYNESDKKIYIHGRTDNQIKHMGYRIELEEIENALCCIKGINEAAVFIINELNGNKIFAVYESSDNLNTDNIKLELKKIVPNYMLPSEIFSIERIPKNANGKTDRLQLKNMYTKS